MEKITKNHPPGGLVSFLFRKGKKEKKPKVRPYRPSILRETGIDRIFKKTVDLCGEEIQAKFAKKKN